MILVTGGAGYIGSHCVMALLEKGYEVIIYDNLSTGHLETVSKLSQFGYVKFINSDLLNTNDLESCFENFKIDSVIHFAAFSQVGESVKNPAKYYRNNVVGTLNLLDAMLNNETSTFVGCTNDIKIYVKHSYEGEYFGGRKVTKIDSCGVIQQYHPSLKCTKRFIPQRINFISLALITLSLS